MTEKLLFECLQGFGIGKKDAKNQFEESGNDLVRDMVSEAYLKRFKVISRTSYLYGQNVIHNSQSGEVENDGSVSWLYALGAKSYIEIGIMNVLRFVEQTTGKVLTKREKAKLGKA